MFIFEAFVAMTISFMLVIILILIGGVVYIIGEALLRPPLRLPLAVGVCGGLVGLGLTWGYLTLISDYPNSLNPVITSFPEYWWAYFLTHAALTAFFTWAWEDTRNRSKAK